MGKRRRKKPAPAGVELNVEIETVGGRGDGLASSPMGRVFVPYTLPGEEVRVRLRQKRGEAWAAELLEVTSPSAQRQPPACGHFESCGGCALQHWQDQAVNDWKRELVIQALASRGLDCRPEPTVPGRPAQRRRTRLTARRGGAGMVLGYHGRASRQIVAIDACPLLTADLAALLAPLRALLGDLGTLGRDIEIALTAADNGVDVLLKGGALDLEARQTLVAFALQHDLARLSWAPLGEAAETVVQQRLPLVHFGEIPVVLPPEAFLQASAEAESALAAEVGETIGPSRRIADLYAGLGTFTLRAQASVLAVEGEARAAAALQAAVDAQAGRLDVRVEVRDLARRPLSDHDLDGFEAVILDPPAAGAQAQAAALAGSAVPRIAYVSCHPGSFARDARLLVDGGYELRRVVPVDQFLWSPRVEIAAAFDRG